MMNAIDEKLAAAFARAPILLPWSIGHFLLAIGYWYIFSDGAQANRWPVFEAVIINVGTSWATGLLFAAAMQRLFKGRRPIALLLMHIAAAALFTLGWYLVNITLQGWAAGSLVDGAKIEPFRGPAFLWQIFQGAAVYGALAGLVHFAMERASRPVAEPVRMLPERLLLKSGDEMITIEPGEIVAIIAADDYSEVRTGKGDHLVRKRLAAFESELPANFVRVHRSAIVNLDRVVRAEPAGGGRIIVHLEGSEPVTASRAGAKILRERTL